MIVDVDKADPLPLRERYDVCIGGGGVAGIVLALKLAAAGKTVLLLEGGAMEYSVESQDLYRGDVVGHNYVDLDTTRLRFFGGTSNHWGGQSRPLDAYDFEGRPNFDSRGWPIGRSDLDPYLDETISVMDLVPFEPDQGPLAGSDGNVKECDFQIRGLRFGPVNTAAIGDSDAIDAFLNANVVDVTLDGATGRVSSFVFRGFRDDAPVYRGVADHFVIAMGGIENPRFLLNVNRRLDNRLGNEADLVGRYFMEHPHYMVGYFVLSNPEAGFPQRLTELIDRQRIGFAPTEKFLREMEVGNSSILLEDIEWGPPETWKRKARRFICEYEALYDIIKRVRYFDCPRDIKGAMSLPPNAGTMRGAWEQSPNPNSRVVLTDEKDAFGLWRAALDWQWLPIDRETIRAFCVAFGQYLARADIGRVKLADWVLDDDVEIPGIEDGEEVGGHHHMGTTRMGFSAADGVVDADCRVFGTENLYVAGSSVFRTVGHANPTLTIVQLALRLGDHLARRTA